MPSEVCAHIVIASEESTRVSSSTAIAYCSVLPPAPPTSSGNGIPIQPSCRHLGDKLVGERLRAVQLAGDGRDLLGGELAHGPLQELRRVIEIERPSGAQRIMNDQFELRTPFGSKFVVVLVRVPWRPHRPPGAARAL